MAAPDGYVSIAEIAELAGYTRAHIYDLISEGRGPNRQPGNQGVLLQDAVDWLKVNSRAAKRAARISTLKRCRALCGAAVTGGGRHADEAT